MPAAQRTIETIEAEIGLARILYLVAVTHSNAMAATEAAAYTTYFDACNHAYVNFGLSRDADCKNAYANAAAHKAFTEAFDATILAQSEVDRTMVDFRKLSNEMAALQAR